MPVLLCTRYTKFESSISHEEKNCHELQDAQHGQCWSFLLIHWTPALPIYRELSLGCL